jgi:hypothetical protein
VSGDTVVVGAYNKESGDVNWAGAAYVFERSGSSWTQQAYLKALYPGVNDWFGWSVAVSGDTVVVGAPNEDSSAKGVGGDQVNDLARNSGAAYVFERSGSSWPPKAYLKASNTNAEDIFGYSVAVSGDTIVVGAPGEDSKATGVNGDQNDNSSTGAGAAYVFERSGSSWAWKSYLKASNTDGLDSFGYSVAAFGDMVVVGAPYESSNATGVNGDQSDDSKHAAGAAYVFVCSDLSWFQQAYLKASNTDAWDFFGYSVAVSGDTAAVGATCEESKATGVNGDQNDNSARCAGAAYVFERSGSTWTQKAYLKASNTDALPLCHPDGDQFGYFVAVFADTVVVGAPFECSKATGVNGDQNDNSAPWAGAAYVFERSDSSWTQRAYLKASNTDDSDQFGWSVAVSGDMVVVGALYESSNATEINGDQLDNSAPAAGAAYVFVFDTDGDGVTDDVDNCPLLANGNQVNTDGDGQGDACDPDDDNDTILDPADNCPVLANANQANTDGDGQGDACDPDDDNDAVLDPADNCPLLANGNQANTDGDGQGNACDPDDDNDTVLDAADNCPVLANGNQANTDGDSQGNACDPDDDNDAVLDAVDNCPLTVNANQADRDGDGVGDACEGELRIYLPLVRR